MHKITALILLTILLALSTTIVLRDSSSDKRTASNIYSEKKLTFDTPERIYVPIIIKEVKREDLAPSTSKAYTSSSKSIDLPEKYLSDQVTTSPKNGYALYTNKDFDTELLVPERMTNVYEYNKKEIGEAALQFKDRNAVQGFFEVFMRKGDVFKKMQEATDDDIAYYDWDLFYEEFQKKVILKSQTLRKSEEIIEINGLVFLTGYYYNPEFESFVRFYRTYKGDLEVTLNYYFPVDWYGENFSYIDNTARVSQELMQGLMSATTKKDIQFFENLVSTLKIK
jgi:hypothetical protein